MSAPSALRVFGHATGIGVITGAGFGAALGTLVAPLFGTLIGLCFGLFYGLFFGLANGVALAVVSRWRPGSGAAVVTGALVSGALALAVLLQFWPGGPAIAAAALMFAVLGGSVAPRAVDPSGG